MIFGFYLAYIFICGMCLGSFFNVVLLRFDKKGGILTGRSECPKCSVRLKWYDLIPLFSYLYLRGNCRYCKGEISSLYPLVEIITGLTVVAYFLVNNSNLGIESIYQLVIVGLFLLLIFFDALYLILPDKIVFPAIILALVYDLVFMRPELPNFILSGFLFGLVFGIIYLVSHGEWMGFGDVKLVMAIGLILGYPFGFFAIISAIWAAALLGIALILFKKANLKTALPFGSFLSAATIVFIIFKNVIEQKINVYQYFF